MQCHGPFEAEGNWQWILRGSTSLFGMCREVFPEQDEWGHQAGWQHLPPPVLGLRVFVQK